MVASATQDFDGDGWNDILWRNQSTGASVVWQMNGATIVSSSSLELLSSTTWKIKGITDFNNDGRADLLWRHVDSGSMIIWARSGSGFTTIGGAYVDDLSMEIEATGDFNADGNQDILWSNTATGQNLVWFMRGGVQFGAAALDALPTTDWKIVGASDFDADGQTDLVLRNRLTGANAVWYMSGTRRRTTVMLPTVADTTFHIVNVADFDRDGKPDLLWRNPTTGQVVLWFMNGVTRTSFTVLSSVAMPWAIMPVTGTQLAAGPPRCTGVAITPGSASASYAQGSLEVAVTGLPEGCTGAAWSAGTDVSWLSVTPDVQEGPGIATISWTENRSASPRSSYVNISGNIFRITQDGALHPTCESFGQSYAIGTPTAAAGSGTVFLIGSPAGCTGGAWTVTTNVPWLTVSPGTGVGSGAFNVLWAANTGANMRTGYVDVDGRSFSVTQFGTAVPGAPHDVSATAGNRDAIVSFFSGSTGGSRITSYTVTASPGGVTASGSDSPLRVTGLVNDTSYTFTVTATNSQGTSDPSAPSAPVTPHAPDNTNPGQDFNLDGNNDIVWSNGRTLQNIAWFMNGATMQSFTTLPPGSPGFQVRGIADFNKDGKPDLLWRNLSTGRVYIWTMNGVEYSSVTFVRGVDDLNWDIAGTGDFNGDGSPDIVWSNPTTGQNIVWFMNDLAYGSFAFLNALPDGYRIVGTGDFNADGRVDIVLRNADTGDNLVWYMNGLTRLGITALPSVADSTWQIVTVADFNGDTKPDLIWRNTVSGLTVMWFMNGTTRTSFAVIGNVPLPWFIVPGQR